MIPSMIGSIRIGMELDPDQGYEVFSDMFKKIPCELGP